MIENETITKASYQELMTPPKDAVKHSIDNAEVRFWQIDGWMMLRYYGAVEVNLDDVFYERYGLTEGQEIEQYEQDQEFAEYCSEYGYVVPENDTVALTVSDVSYYYDDEIKGVTMGKKFVPFKEL